MNPVLAAAAIQFVGLCMFKKGPAPSTIDVVLPRVQAEVRMLDQHPVALRSDIQLVQLTERRRFPVTPVPDAKPMVMDSHTAIIAFLKTSRIGSNWPSQQLKPVPQYEYVELKGEQIRFITAGRNAIPAIPPQLPSVTTGCNNRTLKADYDAPDYRGAAAVVKIVAGALNACHPFINGAESERVDTRLTINQVGPLIIETTRGPKKMIVLDPKNVVIVGNVPTAWINSAPGITASLRNEAGHYEVFFSMLNGTGSCVHTYAIAPRCEGDQPEFVPLEPSNPNTTTAPTSQLQAMRREGGPGVEPGPTDGECANCFYSYACSNSQYP